MRKTFKKRHTRGKNDVPIYVCDIGDKPGKWMIECKRGVAAGPPKREHCPKPYALGSSLIRSGDCPSPSGPRLRPSPVSSLVSWAYGRLRINGEKKIIKRGKDRRGHGDWICC
jgi:hypothetical protein